MKKLSVLLLILILLLCGCSQATEAFDLAATTIPVFDFTTVLCHGTSLSVGRLVTESVSCLHDYTLKVSQMRMIESADAIVISGAGLEEFLDDALHGSHTVIDSSVGTHIHEGDHHDSQDASDDHDHHHEDDPHIWLSPENAKSMANSICLELIELYPEYTDLFQNNLAMLLQQLDDLQAYGNEQLAELTCRELITFHDGFNYLAESFDLTILEAIEEESGSEASAAEIIHLANLVNAHNLPAIFIERNGSDACAGIISAETGVQIYTLDMALSGDSYFDAMYHNINTLKEALG